MKIILFGAGASYADNKVPLTHKLICNLMKKYPNTWGKFPASQVKAFSEDFEMAMKNFCWPETPNKESFLISLLMNTNSLDEPF